MLALTIFTMLTLFWDAYGNAVRFGSVYVQSSRRLLEEGVDGAIRFRHILLPSNRPKIQVSEIIEFELFNDEIVYGVVDRVFDRGVRGGTTWAGSFTHEASSFGQHSSTDWFTLTCYQDACIANIVMESRRTSFAIKPSKLMSETNDDIYMVCEMERRPKSGTLFHPETVVPESEILNMKLQKESKPMMSEAVDTDLIVDIGVIYTPEALQSFGNSHAAMVSQVYLATDETNQVMERSQISLRVRVVFVFRTASASFTEPNSGNAKNDFSTLLSWLQKSGDGHLDEAQTWRNQYQADFVLLINKNSAYAGMAYRLSSASPDWAYGNYNIDYVSGSVWTHEMGHIMGCYHDRYSGSLNSDPNYNGYGHCWEDASKSDCTCYMSIMVYDCNTPTKHCTDCVERLYLANLNVINAGNPTGLPLASCGLHIHQNRYTPITYRKSLTNGGLIFTVAPSTVLAPYPTVVNITGWMLRNGDTVSSVTLNGISVSILSQTTHTVQVLTPTWSSVPYSAGDVVVTTTGGRVSTLKSVFSFIPFAGYYTTDLTSGFLANTPWSSTGTVRWNIYTYNNQRVISKRSGETVTDIAELTTTNLLKPTEALPFYDTVSSIQFKYWAYSRYKSCYDSLNLQSYSGDTLSWSTVWTGTTYSTTTSMPFITVPEISLPSNTLKLKFTVKTASVSNTDCQYYTPLYLADVIMYKSVKCSGDSCPPLPSDPPSAIPTFKPSRVPSDAPTSRPTASPSSKPSSRPSSSPSTVPSKIPSLNPSRRPTGNPSVFPTRRPSTTPSSRPTTFIPTRRPTTFPSIFPSRSPTRPTVQPTTSPSSPTEMPTRRPSGSPTVRPSPGAPTRRPSSTSPSRRPSQSPTSRPTSRSPSSQPSRRPSSFPSTIPSELPTSPTVVPTMAPSSPTNLPSSSAPTVYPTVVPTVSPTTDPTMDPTNGPTTNPTSGPTTNPSSDPSSDPSTAPPTTIPIPN